MPGLTAGAEFPKGLYFPGYSENDAHPTMGDSSTRKRPGSAALHGGGSGHHRFVGGTSQDALNITREMYKITLRRNMNYSLPHSILTALPSGSMPARSRIAVSLSGNQYRYRGIKMRG
jgi:hypothetical protein